MLFVGGMDAIRLLMEDHEAFGRLYRRYEAAKTPRLREDLARRLLHEIQTHITLEERYVYPIAVERSKVHLDEHLETKDALAALTALNVHHHRFAHLLDDLVTGLLRHSAEEERVFFPALKSTMKKHELEALGRLILNARTERAPEPAQESLMLRAATHVFGTWKGMLSEAFRHAWFPL